MGKNLTNTSSWLSILRNFGTFQLHKYKPFLVFDSEELKWQHVGYIRKQNIEILEGLRDLFELSEKDIRLKQEFDDFSSRTQAMNIASLNLYNRKAIRTLRNESYEVLNSFGGKSFFLLDRSSSTFFGTTQWGTHLNGYISSADDSNIPQYWLSKRSPLKHPYPNTFDTLSGGGMPSGISAGQNMQKESYEEANINTRYASLISPVGSISYTRDEHSGLKVNTMYIYDLKCSNSFKPGNNDGEVHSFQCIKYEDLAQKLLHHPEAFKPDIRLVILDFFIRHGYITPDSDPFYPQLRVLLNNDLPYTLKEN